MSPMSARLALELRLDWEAMGRRRMEMGASRHRLRQRYRFLRAKGMEC